MRVALGIAGLLACSASPKKTADYRDIPVEPPPASDAGVEEPLPFEPIEGNAEPPRRPVAPPKQTLIASGNLTIAATTCIPAGTYSVDVDLSTAKLSQVNTGMADLTWCKSILEGVPRMSMTRMKIAIDDGRMTVEWPPGQQLRIAARGDCTFEVTSPPIPSTITFANGRATGTASYSVGTQNHPDESCTAHHAKLALAPVR
jgi:hypothetical protein